MQMAGLGGSSLLSPSRILEGNSSRSEAKLQAKVQIAAAAVGSRYGPCAQARDCRRL